MFRSLILAAVLLAAAPLVANAGEITLLPSVKLQIGDRDNYGNYWDGGGWRDRDYWRRHYEWRDNRWHRHDNGWHKGWYKVDKEDGDCTLTQPRLSPWEAYLQYQYQSPTSRHGFQGIVSAEVRNRALYGYNLDNETNDIEPVMQSETRVFTYNIFVGTRYNTPLYDGYFSRIAVGLRSYHGNCPYGQFRNLRSFSHIGLCLMLE